MNNMNVELNRLPSYNSLSKNHEESEFSLERRSGVDRVPNHYPGRPRIYGAIVQDREHISQVSRTKSGLKEN